MYLLTNKMTVFVNIAMPKSAKKAQIRQKSFNVLAYILSLIQPKGYLM